MGTSVSPWSKKIYEDYMMFCMTGEVMNGPMVGRCRSTLSNPS